MIAAQEPLEIDSEAMIRILNEQLRLYRQLKALAERQRDLIVGENPQPLLTLLADRQTIIDELQSLSQQMNSAQGIWKSHYHEIDPARREEAESLIRDVTETLRSILASDAQDERLLGARKAQSSQEASRVGASQKAAAAYGRSMDRSRNFSETDEAI